MTPAESLAQTVADNRQHILDAADDLNDARIVADMRAAHFQAVALGLSKLPPSATTSTLMRAALEISYGGAA